MALKIARTVTCTCGVVFETKCANRKLCVPCQTARKKMLDSAWYRDHKAHLLQMRRLRTAENKAKRESKPYPAREVPCYGGCGAMVLSTNKNGMKCCPACATRKRAEANYKYRHSDKGKAWQAAANVKKSLDPELQARKRERDRQRYREKREEILAKKKAERLARGIEPRPKRPPKVKPLEAKPRAVKAITLKAKAVVQEAPARRLPTEEEKLLMLRAALKRYHGN
jgi:hypothetical protein